MVESSKQLGNALQMQENLVGQEQGLKSKSHSLKIIHELSN